MTFVGSLGIILLAVITVVLAIPLGTYMYKVFSGQRTIFEGIYNPVERLLYKLMGVNAETEMTWYIYTKKFLALNLVMFFAGYLVLRLMGHLPLNPDHIPSMNWNLAFNTAMSFVTNTNWQSYMGEQAMSYLGQMVFVQFLQFTSIATGVVMAIAFVRSFVTRTGTLGNFWFDFVRIITRVYLPLSILFGILFLALGSPQTLHGAAVVHTLQGAKQTISRGPVASLEAIKQLGNNGGGFFNANSAHPFEGPNAFSDVLGILGMSLIPTALVVTFGQFIKNKKQARVLYIFLMATLVVGAFVVYAFEAAGNPVLAHVLGIHGPNWEGKEVRFGPALSSYFVSATTAYTTGAVNTMHDSLTPLAGLVPLGFMMLNMIFGSGGAGLLNILMFMIITVFLSGLMVGRTPEFLGKKIQAKEIKLATVAMLVHPFLILVFTAIAVVSKAGLAGIYNPGLHGFTEVLYAYTSGAANNGSAFAGLGANSPFYNVTIGIDIMIGRYVSIIAMMAIAGSLATKKTVPASVGTLATDTYSFGFVFMAVVLIVGALTFFPAVAIGPIAEQLKMWATGR